VWPADVRSSSGTVRSWARKPVRVGVLLDSFVVPAWIDKALAQLAETKLVDIAVVVLDKRPVRSVSARSRLRKAFPRLLYDLYTRFDRRLLGSAEDAFQRVDASDRLTCEVLESSPGDLGRPGILARLDELGLDVLLCFASADFGNELARSARYGVWSFPLNDESGLGFFRSLSEGKHVTCTELQMQTDAGRTRTIYRSFSATDLISLQRTRNDAHWKAAAFAVRRIRGLPGLVDEQSEVIPSNDQGLECEQPNGRVPSNLEMAGFLTRLGVRMIRRRVRNLLCDQQWFIAYRRRETGAVPPPDMARFTVITPPTDRFYADPFLLEGPDGRRYLFFEDFRKVEGKAVISRVELLPDGMISTPRVVLERDYHLSYPFVFYRQGNAYLLPETAEARRVELYRAVDFPDRWELDRVLMEDAAIFDATLLDHDGKVWMFASMATSQGRPSDELSVFWADSLEAEWHPHALNPVVSDVRCARPAGRLMVRDGRLIRPGQDGSVRYGYGLVFREIRDLSPDSFREIELGRITPDWIKGNLCTHHYDADDLIEVVDGRLLAPRWRTRKTHVLRSLP
jgi:hypothetical protein